MNSEYIPTTSQLKVTQRIRLLKYFNITREQNVSGEITHLLCLLLTQVHVISSKRGYCTGAS